MLGPIGCRFMIVFPGMKEPKYYLIGSPDVCRFSVDHLSKIIELARQRALVRINELTGEWLYLDG